MKYLKHNQLTPNWTNLRPHAVQARLWNCPTRFAAVVAGRGSGKTELARRRCVYSLAIKKKYPDPIYVYALPTYNQAKKVAWDPIRSLIPNEWIGPGTSISEMTIKTVFGSTLYIVGMDKPHRIEGLQLDGIVLDESSDQRPGTFDRTVRPMLATRGAWCWRIGVPKRSGIGRIDFQSFFKEGNQYNVNNIKLKTEHPDISSFWWRSSDILSEEEIRSIKETTNEQDFLEQYEAHFLDMGGSIYHAFSKENISDKAQYEPTSELLIGCDFNISPMAWVICQLRDNCLYVIDELFIQNTNTEKTLKHLLNKYSFHDQGWAFVGDASSKARKTSASYSDYLIIKNFEGFGKKKVVFAKKNPRLLDRFATVNAALCNAKGERRVQINPICKHIINDLSVMSYKEGQTIPEDYKGTNIGHIADALGYLVMKALPMQLKRIAPATVITSGNAA